MYYGEIKKTDIANGPGVRVSLFVSGCSHHCPGCFNEETWDFTFGQPFTEETADIIYDALSPDHIAGLTVLGGEPMEADNQRALLPVIREVRARFPEKTIWVYSGYLFDHEIQSELPFGSVSGSFRSAHCEVTHELLSLIDVIVDGRFVAAERDLMLRFRGSRNQRLVDVQRSLREGRVLLRGEET